MSEGLRRLLAEIEAFAPRELPLIPTTTPARVRERLAARFDFSTPRPLAEALDDACALLREGTTHSTHPRHFGLFNPTTAAASVAADALVALYNPQLSVRAASPAAVEVERFVLSALAGLLGLDPARCSMSFTTGGAEANHTALALALSRCVPGYAGDGLVGSSVRPAVYASTESHGSLVKAAQVTGLGGRRVRLVEVDRACRMSVRALRQRLADDRAAGDTPAMIVATVGTTSAGAIDPVEALADVARDEGAWLHVDAAWGAMAALSPRTRGLLAGVERADSVTWDAHKSLPVAMGAGMLFTKHPDAVGALFHVDAPYVMRGPGDDPEPYLHSMQWSRRFAGLKVLLTLSTLGWEGVAAGVDRQFALADRLRAGLAAAGWSVLNDTPLPVVCFTHPAIRTGATTTRKVMQRLWRDGVAWVSETRVAGRFPALRACITNVDSADGDVDALVEGLRCVEEAPTS